MTELVFIEGVSGVGKSTMVRMLSEELKAYGYNVKSYVEFDYNNPIDFYCTAYLSAEEYERLITKYVSVVDVMRVNTHALIKRYGKTLSGLDETYDFIIFDGSLLHHPINDMMRNYHIDGKQAVSHITTLLNSLGDRPRRIFYLETNNIGRQLIMAHKNRNQSIPTNRQIEFWEKRHQNDKIVLSNLNDNYQIFDISEQNWDFVREQILKSLVP